MSIRGELYHGRPVDIPYHPATRGSQFFNDYGSTRPMLPDKSVYLKPPAMDVQFRVPMETRRDVDKVKDALDIEGVHGVVCDLPSQTVTVSGNVPFHRLLKKLKHVKRKSRLLTFSSPDSPFSPSFGHESLDHTYGSSYGATSYVPVPIRGPYSPPHRYSSSYVAHSYERPYYEDYEDYRPRRTYY